MFSDDRERLYDGGMARSSCVGCLLEWNERGREIYRASSSIREVCWEKAQNLPLYLTWTKQHSLPGCARVAEDCLCTKNVAVTLPELGDWNLHLLHHRTVQPEVENSRHCFMFVIWITEMVFSRQDRSQCWNRIGREEKHHESIPENPQMGKSTGKEKRSEP